MGFHDRVQESNKKDVERGSFFAKTVVGLALITAPLYVGYQALQSDSVIGDAFSDAANYRNESRENYASNIPDQYKLSNLER